MSSKFTPSQAVDMSKEKDWPMNLGMLDWDSTNIVFTKRSLIEFLKYAGITVDPGFTNIQKLPRYAKFGKMTTDEPEAAVAEDAAPPPATEPSTRSRLLSEEFTDDALATAPPPPTTEASDAASTSVKETTVTEDFKPTRRVRTGPGGTSSIASIFSDDETSGFVPTRKVRERPGGRDNIEGLF
ncbi:hypothetical protein SCLCIDRAFT_1212615 [Scleroderma citrinum Foug A]|uniref:Uncharacterized protein n=1 Tax=Scleroderma citrinum Foug A TaxID=1036808 RepID=A0A0C2ZUG6_9AGAM|nr:hypothetical protein SCLCIDRAFT_1212615 [Scleroderma citrinum Foug A]